MLMGPACCATMDWSAPTDRRRLQPPSCPFSLLGTIFVVNCSHVCTGLSQLCMLADLRLFANATANYAAISRPGLSQ